MVSAAARKPTALLVVVAWHEGSPRRLAARITYTVDTERAQRAKVTAAGPDEVVRVVGGWLDEVEAAARRRDAAVTDE